MDMEARSFSPERSRALLQKVKEYKADWGKLKEDARAAAVSASGGLAARAELGLSDEYYSTSAGQRDRLLQTTDKLQKTSDRIQEGRQQLLQTEVRFVGGRITQSAVHALELLSGFMVYWIIGAVALVGALLQRVYKTRQGHDACLSGHV